MYSVIGSTIIFSAKFLVHTFAVHLMCVLASFLCIIELSLIEIRLCIHFWIHHLLNGEVATSKFHYKVQIMFLLLAVTYPTECPLGVLCGCTSFSLQFRFPFYYGILFWLGNEICTPGVMPKKRLLMIAFSVKQICKGGQIT